MTLRKRPADINDFLKVLTGGKGEQQHLFELFMDMPVYEYGKPIVLHSCGNLTEVFDDIIDDLQYDAKHSYEDNILSVEESYMRYSDRITILGGIDLNFLITSDVDTIRERCRNLLQLTQEKGRYMMGSGNSLAHYVPIEKIVAMLQTVTEM